MSNEHRNKDIRWRELVQATEKFFAQHPWRLLGESLFGVYDHLNNRTLYCTILGINGEVYGLAVYPGAKGLLSYYRIFTEDAKEFDPRIYLESLLISFEDREDLTKQDLDLLKQLGFSFRGRKRWPQFRSFLPGYLDEIPDENEVITMTTALRGATVFVQLEKREELASNDSGKIPVMYYDTENSDWKLNYRTPDSTSYDPPHITIPNEITLQRLKKNYRKIGIWEGRLLPLPTLIEQEQGRSYFPYMGIWADHESGSVLGYEIADPDNASQALLDSFFSAIETSSFVPQTVLVEQEECENILHSLQAKLGFSVRRSVGLPALEEALRSFQQENSGSFAGFEQEDPVPSQGEEANYTNSDWIRDAKGVNIELLRDFREHLIDSGLSQDTVLNHMEISNIFINEFLLSDPEDPLWYDEGISRLDSFFQDWLPKNLEQVGVNRLKRMIAGLKKFYTFLYQEHYLDPEEFEELKKSIQNNREKWIQGS